MNACPITVVGTPQGFWSRWVDQFLTRLDTVSTAAAAPSSDACDAAPQEARALVLVEHPSKGLARLLAEGAVADPKAWLDDWLASGRALLAHVQRHPEACLLVHADDARRHPQALEQLLRARWGDPFVSSVGDVPAASADALTEALAWSFIDRNLAVQDLAEELLASCVVLPQAEVLATVLAPRPAHDGAAAAHRLTELIEAERRLARETVEREAERGALSAELAAEAEQRERLRKETVILGAERGFLSTRLEFTERQLAAMRTELDAQSETVNAAQQESRLLQRQLQQARETLEHTVVAQREAEQAVAVSKQEHIALQARADGATAKQREAESALAESRKECEAASAQLKAATEEAELLLRQLHQVQEELEQTFLARRDAEQAVAASKQEHIALKARADEATAKQREAEKALAESRREREAASAQLKASNEKGAGLQKQLDQIKGELERTAAAQRQAEKALADSRKEREAASAQLKAATEEAELLLQQLHQVQEELEQMFLARRDAENALRSARDECELMGLQMNQVQQELERVHTQKLHLALQGHDDVSIGSVTVIGERDTPPHREVSFLVRDVRVGTRHVAEAAVRLVEHWGRPGLAIFADDAARGLFTAWRETGREDDRPYMLLVHGEENTQVVLESMGTLDWQLLQGLVMRLQQALQQPGCGASTAWRSLAQRLLTSLQEQPARLRHESVRVMPIAQDSPEVARWGLVLERASYRGRTWPRLTIQWRANTPRPSLELVRDEESGPPLLVWPADQDGAPVRSLRLPFGADPHAPEIRGAWDALAGPDRIFVSEILNLMPKLAVHVQAACEGTAGSTTDLQAAATHAVMSGRAALQPQPGAGSSGLFGSGLLRRVARRLRTAAAMPSVAPVAPSETRA